MKLFCALYETIIKFGANMGIRNMKDCVVIVFNKRHRN